MKGLLVIVLAVALFFAGALYGIEKNQEKESAVEKTAPVHSSYDSAASAECETLEVEEDVPWISQLAGGIGEGVAVSFNGFVLVLSEVLSAGS